MAAPATPPTVDELVFEFLERVHAGESAPNAVLDSICDAWPTRAGTLRAAVAQLAGTGMIGAEAEPAGERIGPYRLGRRLGSGGMGVVYLAWHNDEANERPVALKLLRSDRLSEPGARERFEREVNAASLLDHPNIVRVQDRGIHRIASEGGLGPEQPYVVLEYHRGGTLEVVIRSLATATSSEPSGARLLASIGVDVDPLKVPAPFRGPWHEIVARITREVARALAHAHARGVVHRDVKPSNVLVTPEGRVLLLDFGLAALRGSGRLTASGVQLGSLPYMSPEQVRGESVSDERTDVYSLAVTSYELLTLQLPFRGSDPERLGLAILEGGAPPLSKVLDCGGSTSLTALDTVIGKAMESEPATRYPSADAFAADLTAVLHGRSIVARAPSNLQRSLRWMRRRPFVVTTSVLAGLLFIGGPLGYGIMASRHSASMGRSLDASLRHLSELVKNADAGLRALSSGPLVGDPRLLNTRMKSLDDALATLARAERDSAGYLDGGSDRAKDAVDQIQQTRARLIHSRAGIHISLGDPESALQDYAVHDELVQDLLTRHPRSRAYARDLAASLANQARAKNLLGRFEDAIECVDGSIERLSEMIDASESSIATVRRLAAAHLIRARSFAGISDDDGANRDALRAEELLTQVLARGGGDWRDHTKLAEARIARARHIGGLRPEMRLESLRAANQDLGLALQVAPDNEQARYLQVVVDVAIAVALANLERNEEATFHHARATATIQRLLSERPTHDEYIRMDTAVRDLAGYVSMRAGDIHSGLATLRASVLEARRRVEREPDSFDAREDLARYLGNLANQLMMSDALGPHRLVEAEALATEAIDLARSSSEEQGQGLLPMIHDVALYTRIVVRAKAGNLADARADIELLESRTEAPDPDALRFIADARNEFFLALVESHAGAEDVSRAREATLVALETAIRAGYDDANELRSTPALDPFREDPRFIALLEGL